MDRSFCELVVRIGKKEQVLSGAENAEKSLLV